jgi:hypothetical protein
MKIFLLTDEQGLRSDDKYLVDALTARNCHVVIEDWEKANLSGPCNVLIRTPWNYAEKIKEFISKILEVEKGGGKILHPSNIVLWNAHKEYLCDFDFCVKTELIRLNQDTPLDYPVVIKPFYGAGGKNTYCIHSQQEYLKLSPHFGEEFLVQPYHDEIKSIGEFSFIFFEHHFSHAVLKKAQGGEFRIQDEYGGVVEKYIPDESEIREVQKLLNTFPHRYEFARVDFIRVKGEIQVMELEVIEPELFFRTEPNSADRFADVVVNYFKK